ncbi:MAG: hypothetical protein OCU20_03810 [Methanophagales archaeon]|nr:hypothetical protein [Methanophagales archaeon]MCW7069534.1 hypothetical protein [Methanophagales archaeon]MCW7073008.1 hypothetical protein [Methanophagales archaeon]
MNLKSYFEVYELSLMLLFALGSAMLNTYLPIKAFTQWLGVPGPAAGMAFLGGFIFVFWVALAYVIIKKRYAGIVTSLLIASFCIIITPWYGIVSPIWFGIYAIVALLSMGSIVELMASASKSKSRVGGVTVTGGGLGNVACLVITWIAIGVHAGVWIPSKWAPILILGAFVSGCAGSLMAYFLSLFLRSE